VVNLGGTEDDDNKRSSLFEATIGCTLHRKSWLCRVPVYHCRL